MHTTTTQKTWIFLKLSENIDSRWIR